MNVRDKFTKIDYPNLMKKYMSGVCGAVHDRDINAAINLKNWPTEYRCQNVENSSVDDRSFSKEPKKQLVCEALTSFGNIGT